MTILQDPHVKRSAKIVELFQQLGETIRKEWIKKEYSEDEFSKIAIDCLAKANLSKKMSAKDILNVGIEDDPLISAHQSEIPFGDLQLTLYKHSKFYIEALVWFEGTTTIHDHAFSGAFCVLQGSSVNAEYHFSVKEKVNNNFYIGNLSLNNMRKLSAGDVIPIMSGRRLIHSVFHLDSPTVTIVARTVQDDDSMPQLEYRGNSIAITTTLEHHFLKRIQSLRFLAREDYQHFMKWFLKLFEELPIHEKYWLYRAFFTNLSIDIRQALKEKAVIFDERVSLIMKVVEYEFMQNNVVKLRTNTRDPDLRYFLALLLNLSSWTDILEFAKQDNVDIKNTLNLWFSKVKLVYPLLGKILEDNILLFTRIDGDIILSNEIKKLLANEDNPISYLLFNRVATASKGLMR